jgi:ABC-type oligopeptide transport system ATPase subunit
METKIDIEKLDWKKFQDFCSDVLLEEGFEIVRRGGIGSDRGMDIIAQKKIEYAPGLFKPFKWLVQCKHKLKQGSLSPVEVGDFSSDLPRHQANGYWLMTNAYLSTSLEDKITSFNENNPYGYSATYSNGKGLRDFVFKYRQLLKKYGIEVSQADNQNINWREINPFKELQSFSESDKHFFFGRTREIEEILNKVYKFKIVGLFGESGTGKTSLLNAGLIPKLKDEGFLVISVRCLDEPIKRLKESIIHILKKHEVQEALIESRAVTNNFPNLIFQLKSVVEAENLNVIMVVDQFEELFTRADEQQREQLSKGLLESLVQSTIKGRICFLLSLREDYIGQLWDWSHRYHLDDIWIQTYRIARFNEFIASQCIIQPLEKLNISVDKKFVQKLIEDLKILGDGTIYPPYLQILCSNLFEGFKKQHATSGSLGIFSNKLLQRETNVEAIIIEYLSDSMLNGLTEEEKTLSENVLDVLTGSEGLRAFLSIDDIARYVNASEPTTAHIVEHLTKKKIVHAVVEKDQVKGYELVHDFLSKKFFEKLEPEARKAKTLIEIFRKAFKEWKQHGVLASKDRLEILYENLQQLNLKKEEWFFLMKSSFSNYWFYENKWTKVIDTTLLGEISLKLIHDKDENIVKNAIRTLGKLQDRNFAGTLKEIITNESFSSEVRETAIDQFAYSIKDEMIIETLKNILQREKEYKLRKSAVYAYAKNISHLNLSEDSEEKKLFVLYEALNDTRAPVRKQVADALGYLIVNRKSSIPLLKRLEVEDSINPRKAIVAALGALLKKGEGVKMILPKLETISQDNTEDYRVKEEASRIILYHRLE